jgi:hypothetical protein
LIIESGCSVSRRRLIPTLTLVLLHIAEISATEQFRKENIPPPALKITIKNLHLSTRKVYCVTAKEHILISLSLDLVSCRDLRLSKYILFEAPERLYTLGIVGFVEKASQRQFSRISGIP